MCRTYQALSKEANAMPDFSPILLLLVQLIRLSPTRQMLTFYTKQLQ